MTWVKICGITNLEDALTAVDAGADAVGFVFYEKSLRNVTLETVREIVEKLPVSVQKIGVFVGKSMEYMENIAEQVGLTGVQLHVTKSPDEEGVSEKPNLNIKKYVALPARYFYDETGQFKGFGWSEKAPDVISAIFLDSGTVKEPGGTGKRFDWTKAEQTVRVLTQTFNVVVAGGLNPENVREAIRVLEPWGVDVSSGVEARPGKKDPQKVRAFVAAARNAEKN